MVLVDPPSEWSGPADVTASTGLEALVTRDANAALFFPRLRAPDPLDGGSPGSFAPCGAVAGVIARSDTQRGVWKAPAGPEAGLVGVSGLTVDLTESDTARLASIGVNGLRHFPAHGPLVWGARTLAGADSLASEWKYLPVRRLALFIEESLFRGTKWVVSEPNAEPLWAEIRLSVGAFMHDLLIKGALQGATAREAYFVKCDAGTTTQSDVSRGVVKLLVGFAPLRRAEFVVLEIQQKAGQSPGQPLSGP